MYSDSEYNEYYEYNSDSELSDSEYENTQIIEYENDIEQDNFEYQEIVYIMDVIENFRRYNNPLILDELETINLIRFLTNTE